MSTFVSVGNATQSFARLLDAVARIAPSLPQPIIIQHGRTPFESDVIEHFDFVDESRFRELLAGCTVFISHGGGGSVLSAVNLGKKAVVVPRVKAHHEMVDDHQVYFASELARQGLIVPVYDLAELPACIEHALTSPELPAFEKETLALPAIDAAVRAVAGDNGRLCLVTPSGGHLTEIRALAPVYAHRPHDFVINVPIVEPPDMQGRTTVITTSQRDWKFMLNLWEAWTILRRQKPRAILTTGGGFSVAFTLVGNLLGIPTIYIETVGKVIVPTVTGKFMYRLTGRFFYQWTYLQPFFPKGQYIGLII